MTKSKTESEVKQTSLFDESAQAPPTPKASKGRSAPRGKSPARDEDKSREGATELMKTVARRTQNRRNMDKVFTPEEIAEITAQIEEDLAVDPDRVRIDKEKYRKIKRKVRDMEKGNKQRVIAFPSITRNGFGTWYKVIDFSALYYVYRLADRMGRSARLLRDTDKSARAIYVASFQDIELFKKQFLELEKDTTIETTVDGVIIFNLKNPLTDDEVAQLRMIEETRRDRMHNVLKPKAMDPATYQAILTCIRQISPKVCKLDRTRYWTVGEYMIKDLSRLMSVYFDFADGIIDRREAGKILMDTTNKLLAAVAVLSETQVWRYDMSATVGENLNEVKRLVRKDFNVKEIK